VRKVNACLLKDRTFPHNTSAAAAAFGAMPLIVHKDGLTIFRSQDITNGVLQLQKIRFDLLNFHTWNSYKIRRRTL
jgi:hypothetical protein